MQKEQEQKQELLLREINASLSIFDSRYSNVTEKLKDYFSDYALIRYKVKLEISWLIFWLHSTKKNIKQRILQDIKSIEEDFDLSSYARIKEIEGETQSVFLAIEQFIVEKLKDIEVRMEIVNSAGMNCSINDINETAYSLMMKEGLYEAWMPVAKEITSMIPELQINEDLHILSSDDEFYTLTEEIQNYIRRLKSVFTKIEAVKIGPKVGVILDTEYPRMSEQFISEMGMDQADSDYIIYIADYMRHFNNILFDLNTVLSTLGNLNPIWLGTFESSEEDLYYSNTHLMDISNNVAKKHRSHEIDKAWVLGVGLSLQSIERTTDGIRNVLKIISKLSN